MYHYSAGIANFINIMLKVLLLYDASSIAIIIIIMLQVVILHCWYYYCYNLHFQKSFFACIFIFLCSYILTCLLKYSDVSSATVTNIILPVVLLLLLFLKLWYRLYYSYTAGIATDFINNIMIQVAAINIMLVLVILWC